MKKQMAKGQFCIMTHKEKPEKRKRGEEGRRREENEDDEGDGEDTGHAHGRPGQRFFFLRMREAVCWEIFLSNFSWTKSVTQASETCSRLRFFWRT